MWVAYFFASFLTVAAIALTWWLTPLWRNAHAARVVRCPQAAKSVSVRLDPWYAVKMHLRGEPELRVLECTEWPGRAACRRECLTQIGAIR